MCGILSILSITEDMPALREKTLKLVKRLRHRGPDWSGIYSCDHAILAHERLSIVDIEHGAQPLYDVTTGRVLAVNGEIYNHRELRQKLKKPHIFQTHSDCEVILYLYDEYGPDFINMLNGIFAFVLYDPNEDDFMIGRDHIGIVPLYMGRDDKGHLYVASEMKAIFDSCRKIEEFSPGHYLTGKENAPTRYYKSSWMETVPSKPYNEEELRGSLESAVQRQLMCDVPYGLVISGGVDSSLVAAIAAQYRSGRIENQGKTPAWWPQIHSFTIGLKGAPDLAPAKKVADHIGSIHHEIHFTVQEGLDAIPDVIYHLETFDVTSIRAATPMYLMSRKIRAMGIKMILSGEGADEIFGGYLYFHKAPNAVEFHQETVRKISALHMYDCLRANKATAAWGVEARVPFLDKEFLEVAMNIDPQEKMVTKEKMEKHILRQSFQGYIPEEILWRQKEQFSDGVGYSWVNSLKAHTEKKVTDQMMKNARHRFPVKTPTTKEAYWYRVIFENHFPNPTAIELVPVGPSVACSTATAIEWDRAFKDMIDPSGRAVRSVHKNAEDWKKELVSFGEQGTQGSL